MNRPPRAPRPLTNLLQSHAPEDGAHTDLAHASRRQFVRHMALGAAALGTLPLTACGGGDDGPRCPLPMASPAATRCPTV